MIRILNNLSRKNKQIIMLTFDALAITCVIYAAFWIRLGYFFYPAGNHELLILIHTSPLFGLPIFFSFGLYQEVVRYVSFRGIWLIIQASSTYAILWGLIIFMIGIEPASRSVILINWFLIILIVLPQV